MLDLPKPYDNVRKQLARAPPERKAVGGGGRDGWGKERKRRKGEVKGGRTPRKMKKVDVGDKLGD